MQQPKSDNPNIPQSEKKMLFETFEMNVVATSFPKYSHTTMVGVWSKNKKELAMNGKLNSIKH